MKKITWRNYHKRSEGFEIKSEDVYKYGENYGRFYIDIDYDEENKKYYILKHFTKEITKSYDRNSLKDIANDIINGIVK